MITCRTPLRISLFGGGTDFPDWYKKNESLSWFQNSSYNSRKKKIQFRISK